jgi:hypothetical protein
MGVSTMPLFCTSCGKEVFPGETYCSRCGKRAVPEPKAESSSPPISHHQPEAAPRVESPQTETPNRLDRLYTRNWKGTCPSCDSPPYTVENARCPVDGSPLVIAFNAPRWNPFAYPIHTAHVRCLGDCGYRSSHVECTRCVGKPIQYQNLRFTMPLGRYLAHNGLALAVAFFFLFPVFLIYFVLNVEQGPDGKAPPITFGNVLRMLWNMLESAYGMVKGVWVADNPIMVFCYFLLFVVFLGLPVFVLNHSGAMRLLRRWHPFRRTFNFEQVDRAAHRWKRLKAEGKLDGPPLFS